MLDDVDVDIDDHADGGGGDDAQPDPVMGLSIRILSNCARIRPRFHCLESKTTSAQETCSTDLFDRD